MKTTLLATAAFLFTLTVYAGATVPAADGQTAVTGHPAHGLMLADKGGNGSGGSSGGGSSGGGSDDSSSGASSHSGSNDDDADSNDDNGGNSKGSGRSKPRIPGGRGCDSARDKIEHPECAV